MGTVEQGVEADEARASDGAPQLIPDVRRTSRMIRQRPNEIASLAVVESRYETICLAKA